MVASVVALLMFAALPAKAAAAPADPPSVTAKDEPVAGISIIKGSPARIADWPWQVAIADRNGKGRKRTARKRTFCGGAVIAPDLVLTAGHCVARLRKSQARRLEIIAGRTWLNRESTGETSTVREVLMPTDASGKRRYREQYGSADWDVAILQLGSPLAATPIKLAGPDEYRSWAPGQTVHTTGWGVRRPESSLASPRLRMATQVMLKSKICRMDNGRNFRPATMNCHGAPGGNSSTCFGDSGGPSVTTVGTEHRLVGLTSFGDDFCRGNYPSVDARVAGKAIRSWVAATAMAVSGVDVVGTGGEVAAPRSWCRVPHLWGLTPSQARKKLRQNRCELGSVGRDRYSRGSKGRIVGTSRFPGWLAPVGFRLKVWMPG